MRLLIVGGGIGGFTAAIALRRVGIDAHVYEAAPTLREVGAGLGLASNALWTLNALGLGPEIRSNSQTRVQGGLTRWDGRVLVPTSDGVGDVAVIHRAELLALLARNLDAERLHMGSPCVGFEQNDSGVTARFRSGETAQGDALIGADGIGSVVRSQLLIGQPPRYSGYTCWRAVVDFKGSDQLNVVETWGQGRRFGIAPMSRGRVYWFATKNAPAGERFPPGRTKDRLAALFRNWHEPIEPLIAATSEDSILQNDIYDMDPLPKFVQGRAALLGDAAHLMTPNLGQGACQAIEDGIVLAACLKKCSTVYAGLREYEKRRMPRTGQIVLNSRWLGAIAQRENPALCWIRDALVLATPKRIAVRRMRSLLEAEILAPSEKALFESP